jgi:hypothetical protein
MTEEAYRYRFKESVNLHEAEETLLLSFLATEGLYGQARVRMDGAYSIDKALRAIIVDAGTEVGQAVNAIFTAFILREFGSGRIHVRRVEGLCACGSQEGRQ